MPRISSRRRGRLRKKKKKKTQIRFTVVAYSIRPRKKSVADVIVAAAWEIHYMIHGDLIEHKSGYDTSQSVSRVPVLLVSLLVFVVAWFRSAQSVKKKQKTILLGSAILPL